jgi:hypothetical protein
LIAPESIPIEEDQYLIKTCHCQLGAVLFSLFSQLVLNALRIPSWVSCTLSLHYSALTMISNKLQLDRLVVRGRGIVFRHYYRSLAKSAGKDFRDGAVVPFQ